MQDTIDYKSDVFVCHRCLNKKHCPEKEKTLQYCFEFDSKELKQRRINKALKQSKEENALIAEKEKMLGKKHKETDE